MKDCLTVISPRVSRNCDHALGFDKLLLVGTRIHRCYQCGPVGLKLGRPSSSVWTSWAVVRGEPLNSTPDQLIREWFECLWNQGQEETIERLAAPDFVVHGIGPDAIRGAAALKPLYRVFRAALPDIHISVDRTVTEGDMVAAHCHVTGTHTGEGLGVAPTGRRVEFWGIAMGRVRGGQLVEGWNCFDFLSLYEQIGRVPRT